MNAILSCRSLLMVLSALGALAVAGSGPAVAGVVSIVDPAGGAEIDVEVGNLSESAFEALIPLVNDLENGSGPQADNQPFGIGSVGVTGTYWSSQANANYSGGRSSLTISGVDGAGDPAGTWAYAGVSPIDGAANYVQFIFAPDAGEIISAVGLGWLGRDNRAGDSVLTATVTFADNTTLSSVPLTIDGNGDGLPNGKDVFIGFQDVGGHGGIASLEVLSEQSFQSFITFHGWDDLGVVLSSSNTAIPEPSTLAITGLGLLFLAGHAWRRRKRESAA